jgi:hypothetical protein
MAREPAAPEDCPVGDNHPFYKGMETQSQPRQRGKYSRIEKLRETQERGEDVRKKERKEKIWERRIDERRGERAAVRGE